MGNSTKDFSPTKMHEQLTDLVETYRGLLRADERRLQDAMREYERSYWADPGRRAF